MDPALCRLLAVDVQRILECMQAQQRAFVAARTHRHPKQIVYMLRRQIGGVIERHPLQYLTQYRHAGLADRAALPLPADAADAVAVDVQLQFDRVAAAQILLAMRHRCIGQHLFRTRMAVVIEDVFGVEIHDKK